MTCWLVINRIIFLIFIIITLILIEQMSAHARGIVPVTNPGDQVPSCELPILRGPQFGPCDSSHEIKLVWIYGTRRGGLVPAICACPLVRTVRATNQIGQSLQNVPSCARSRDLSLRQKVKARSSNHSPRVNSTRDLSQGLVIGISLVVWADTEGDVHWTIL